MTDQDGALLFARFAYPPNELGYCGPGDSGALLERVAAGAAGPGLRELARAFEGAWPYLELIAGLNGLADPLDRRVVEAYWVGNALLDRVRPLDMCRSLEDRFAARVGPRFDRLVVAGARGALPHHAFHVFGVYPWVGLLRSGTVVQPLHVLDRCRIRWGVVESVDGDTAVVRSRPLLWDGVRLGLGLPRPEQVRVGAAGRGLVAPAAGDWCALHWDWVCDVLTPRRLMALQRYSARQMDLVNGSQFPAPATVLA